MAGDVAEFGDEDFDVESEVDCNSELGFAAFGDGPVTERSIVFSPAQPPTVAEDRPVRGAIGFNLVTYGYD